MDILIFISGVITGAIIVFYVMNMSQKSSKLSSEEMFNQMQLHFENLANKIFNESSKELTVQNKEKLDEFFAKFKEKIEDFEKRSELNFKVELENFSKFDENIKSFIEAGQQISKDTSTLVSTMKSDNRTQGIWGEIVLERVLEASGLKKGEEYLIQKSAEGGRPDAIVLLPEKKCVMIDAKTSLASFSAYLEAEDEELKSKALKEFKESTKSHISGLNSREYNQYEDYSSTGYILMFIPIESCYSLMFCDDNYLWDLAWKNKIMPVSPSTLLAALRIINSFLVTDRQNKNSLEIARLCTTMLDKFSDMVKDILGAQKGIKNALIKLDGRGGIISVIQKIKELGGVTNKSFPSIEGSIEFEE